MSHSARRHIPLLLTSLLLGALGACVPSPGAPLTVTPTAKPAATISPTPIPTTRPTATPDPATAVTGATAWGVYAGPGTNGVAGATAFGVFSGRPPAGVLDFPPTSSWADIVSPTWLFSAHADIARFEYSLPMLPDGPGYSLAACAGGNYNAQWTTLAKNLIAYRLAGAIVRPGWEFNGDWYGWSAIGKAQEYLGCFRQIVATMRAVPGQRFLFDWNPNGSNNKMPAEQAYPGDSYVDVIGVDLYDMSWTNYPVSSGTSLATAQARTWNWLLNGDHGLKFWSSFALAHGRPMALTEWGVTWRSDGHGGGDDPSFVNNIFNFARDPANRVAYAHYLNFDTSATTRHKLTGDTRFPLSAAKYRQLVALLPPSPTP